MRSPCLPISPLLSWRCLSLSLWVPLPSLLKGGSGCRKTLAYCLRLELPKHLVSASLLCSANVSQVHLLHQRRKVYVFSERHLCCFSPMNSKKIWLIPDKWLLIDYPSFEKCMHVCNNIQSYPPLLLSLLRILINPSLPNFMPFLKNITHKVQLVCSCSRVWDHPLKHGTLISDYKLET